MAMKWVSSMAASTAKSARATMDSTTVWTTVWPRWPLQHEGDASMARGADERRRLGEQEVHHRVQHAPRPRPPPPNDPTLSRAVRPDWRLAAVLLARRRGGRRTSWERRS